MQTVSIEKYERATDDEGNFTGMLRYVGNRHAQEVYDDLVAALGSMLDECEYSTLGMRFKYPQDYPGGSAEIPRFRRVIVYPVTGGSEGHYVHVDLHAPSECSRSHDHVVNLMLVKTFGGMAHARAIANRLADVLEV